MVIDDDSKRELLLQARTIAVVGLSPDESKASNRVARYLIEAGYRIIPVNPAHSEISGIKSAATLSDIAEPIDIVDIFMRPDRLLSVVEEAVRLSPRPKAVWLQLGIVSEEARRLVESAGIAFLQDVCIKMEHDRLL
jgi:predicted CoA-binding protein